MSLECKEKKKNLSDEISNDDESDLLKRKSSINPDSRCAICLTLMEDATVLSGCFHTFCYFCIKEWLKMKPECPLCKRVPDYFKHKFNLLPGQTVSWDLPSECVLVTEMRANLEMESILARTSYPADVEKHAVIEVIRHLDEEIRMLQHMSYRSSGKESTYLTAILDLEKEKKCYQNLLTLFSTSPRRVIFNEPAFRRVIYLRNLSPRSIVPPDFHHIFNPNYIRNNEKHARSQLMPYIIREHSSISRNDVIDIEFLLNIIFNHLKGMTNRLITVDFLKKAGIRHPHQYLNNITHFASTSQTLAVYDQNSEYIPRGSGILPYISGNDDILVLNSVVNNDIQVVGETVSSMPNRLNSRNNNRFRTGREEQIIRSVNASRRRPRLDNIRNLHRRGVNDSVVNIGDSSGSNSSSDTDVLAYTSNIGLSRNDDIPSTTVSYSSYIFTPSTNNWRLSVSTNLSNLINQNSSSINNTNTNLLNNRTFVPTYSSPANLITILQGHRLDTNSNNNNSTQFLSDDEEISQNNATNFVNNLNTNEIVEIDDDDNSINNQQNEDQQTATNTLTSSSQLNNNIKNQTKKRSSSESIIIVNEPKRLARKNLK